jgi:hypothetical protein
MHAPDALSPHARREGFLLGAPVGATLAGGAPPPGRRHAAVALGDALLEELLGGGVDLRRLAARWVRWRTEDGHGVDAALGEALAHLEEFDAPPTALEASGAWAVAVTLPAALASASPRTMVSGAFHTARLVDPSADAGLAAVSVVVAAARYLEGSRDVLPEVLALLRSNDAPHAVYDRFAGIARDPRARVPAPTAASSALDVATWALRTCERERQATTALGALPHAATTAAAGAVLGALLGARDGPAGWPSAWIADAGEEVAWRQGVVRQLAGEG